MWLLALDDKSSDTPSIFTLSRQPVPLLEGSDRSKVARGAYVIWSKGSNEPDLTIVSTGAEVTRAIDAAKKVTKFDNVRVVSMPSQKHFDVQDAGYKELVIPSTSLIVAIEAWASYGWARYAHASLSMQTFVSLSCQLTISLAVIKYAANQGHSAPQEQLYEYFGFGPDNMARKIDSWGSKWQEAGRLPRVGEFEELLLGTVSH